MAQSNNSNDGASDKGGLAPHKNHCPHVTQAIDIPLDIASKLIPISIFNGNNGNVTCSVPDCDKGECWLCLKCHQIFCGRYGNQHMIMHYISTQTEHCMAMGINDLSFWCYKCENYINHLSVKKVWDFYSVAHIARFNEAIPPALLAKCTFNKKPATTFTMQAIQESEDEEEEVEDSKENDAQFDDEKKEESNNRNLTNEAIEIIDELISRLSIDIVVGNMKTALFYSEDCLKHKPGNNSSHVERPERCSTSYEMLTNYGILKHLIEMEPREATMKELKCTHSDNHVEIIIGNENKHGWYDSDTFYNTHSARAAKLAAGATIDLMAGILQNKYDNGFALVRPPGHHCEHNKGMII